MSNHEISSHVAGVVSSLLQDAFSGSESALVSANHSCNGELIPALVSFVLRNPDVMTPWVYEYAGSVISRCGQGGVASEAWSDQSDLVKFEFRIFVSLVRFVSSLGGSNKAAPKKTSSAVAAPNAQPKRRGRPPKNRDVVSAAPVQPPAIPAEPKPANEPDSNGGRASHASDAEDEAWAKVARSAYKKTIRSRKPVDDDDDVEDAGDVL